MLNISVSCVMFVFYMNEREAYASRRKKTRTVQEMVL